MIMNFGHIFVFAKSIEVGLYNKIYNLIITFSWAVGECTHVIRNPWYYLEKEHLHGFGVQSVPLYAWWQ